MPDELLRCCGMVLAAIVKPPVVMSGRSEVVGSVISSSHTSDSLLRGLVAKKMGLGSRGCTSLANKPYGPSTGQDQEQEHAREGSVAGLTGFPRSSASGTRSA